MCGHSLGAGVAGVLGLVSHSRLDWSHVNARNDQRLKRSPTYLQKWADPKTCLTTRSSGLPVGRRVSVYCFAPP